MVLSDSDLAELADRARAATQEPYRWGHSGTETHEAAIAYMDDALGMSDSADIHMVFVGDPTVEGATRIVAYTGNGPTSEANATYLSCMTPETIIAICDELRNARHQIRHLRRTIDELSSGQVG
jgi:hypothetical protein